MGVRGGLVHGPQLLPGGGGGSGADGGRTAAWVYVSWELQRDCLAPRRRGGERSPQGRRATGSSLGHTFPASPGRILGPGRWPGRLSLPRELVLNFKPSGLLVMGCGRSADPEPTQSLPEMVSMWEGRPPSAQPLSGLLDIESGGSDGRGLVRGSRSPGWSPRVFVRVRSGGPPPWCCPERRKHTLPAALRGGGTRSRVSGCGRRKEGYCWTWPRVG